MIPGIPAQIEFHPSQMMENRQKNMSQLTDNSAGLVKKRKVETSDNGRKYFFRLVNARNG
jgi:hypothetical protein